MASSLIPRALLWTQSSSALYLLSYPLFALGVFFYPPDPERGLPLAEVGADLALCLLLAALGLGFLYLVPGEAGRRVLLWLYALSDALLLAMLFSVLARAWEPLARLGPIALSVGLGLAAFVHVQGAHLAQSGALITPVWSEALGTLVQGCVIWAAVSTLCWRGLRQASPAGQRRAGRVIDALALAVRLAIMLAIGAAFVGGLALFAQNPQSAWLLTTALLLTTVLMVRFGLLRARNEQLARELRRAADELQQRVDDRTRELAGRVAEVQQLRAEAELRASEQSALLNVSELVNSSLRLDEVLDAVVRRTADLFHADGVGVYFYDEATRALVLRAHHTPFLSEEQMEALQRIPLSDSASAAEVVRTQLPLRIPDTAVDPRVPPELLRLGVKSSLLLPMLAKDKLLGVLILDSVEPNHFAEHDAELALALAQNASNASERARLHEALATSLEELKSTQVELLRSQRLEALAAMVAGAAHELNNPLTVVQGYSELLLRQNIAPQMRTDIERILVAIERSRTVVAALLAFGQREESERRLTDINHVLDQTLSLCAFDLEREQIRVELRLGTELPPVEADASLLRQVFFNIILNARQAISETHHGGQLTVRTLQEGRMVRIEVSDDGPGIAPEIMDKIFDPFFTTRPQGQGIGLGLSLCFGIVSEHGGRIWATSPALQQHAGAPGPGATLVVELPAATW
jgi:signal transduction histidine kinase